MAEKQSYKNHRQWYAPHHFIFYPLIAIALVLLIMHAIHPPEDKSAVWMAMAIMLIFIAWVSYMLRQHYALGNQDRIIRLEMRLRFYILTHKRLEPIEAQLSLGQLLALRFASDEELPALIDRAVAEKLSGDEIKRAIKDWQGDYMRL
jgi:hypothetical protein